MAEPASHQVLREVRRGEVVLVTDRGQVVAELRPPGSGTGLESGSDLELRRLASPPGVQVAEPRPREKYPRSPLRLPRGTALDLLAEGRDDW